MARPEIVSNLAYLVKLQPESNDYSFAPEGYLVLDTTETLAVAEGNLYIETRHLLLALIDDDRALAELQGTGIPYLDLKEELERVGERVKRADTRPHPFPVPTKTLMGCIHDARYPSWSRNNHILPEDLFEGIRSHSNNNAAKVLRRLQGGTNINDATLLWEY